MSLTAHKAYPEQVAQVAPGKRQAALLEKLPIDMCELVAAVVPRTDLLPLALTCHALHPLCVARAKTERVHNKWVVHKGIGMATASVARVEWAVRVMGMTPTPEWISHAAEGGLLEVVVWLHEYDTLWDKGVCARAARGGHLEVAISKCAAVAA